jgi:hypothetical protein
MHGTSVLIRATSPSCSARTSGRSSSCASVVACIALIVGAAAWSADEFRDAKILDVEAKEETVAGYAAPYQVIPVQLGEQKISGRPWQMGRAYLLHHPEAIIVGSTVPARIDKNMVEIKIGPEQKLVKLKIQRIENLGSSPSAK